MAEALLKTYDGFIPMNRLQSTRRLPAYEARAQRAGLPVDEVVGCRLPGIMGVAAPVLPGGRYRIWLTEFEACALRRLAIFEHESLHVRRGDCAREPASQAETEAREAACQAAALGSLWESAAVVVGRDPSLSLDPCICERCFERNAPPCAQGRDVLERVNAALAPL